MAEKKDHKTYAENVSFYIDVIKCRDILNQLVETYFPSKNTFLKNPLICTMLQAFNKTK